MSFATSILTVITGNVALNAAVNGIYYQIIPDNLPMTNISVVYTFKLIDSIDHLAKNNEIDIYSLDVAIIAKDTATIDTVTGLIRALLDNYKTSPFKDVHCENTDIELDGEREQYIGNLNYKIHYQN